MLIESGIAIHETTKEQMTVKKTRKSFKERLRELENQECYIIKE